jgi:hypothetical protein
MLLMPSPAEEDINHSIQKWINARLSMRIAMYFTICLISMLLRINEPIRHCEENNSSQPQKSQQQEKSSQDN